LGGQTAALVQEGEHAMNFKTIVRGFLVYFVLVLIVGAVVS
jgi:hypothetical protein